jgi:hypothetical protein
MYISIYSGDGTALIEGAKGSGRAGWDGTNPILISPGIVLERVHQKIQLFAYRTDDGFIGAVRVSILCIACQACLVYD